MIRNLKVLIAAAMALMAFGALSATAHAAEEKFHCSVEPCTVTLSPDLKPEESLPSTTAHQVFVVNGLNSSGTPVSTSFTCNQLTGEATSTTATAETLTFTNLKYENSAGEQKCKVGASETVEVKFNSCDYQFTSLNGSTSTAQVHVLCPAGKVIEILIKGTTCLDVSPFTSTGIGYHTIGTAPNRHVTATANVAVPNAALTLTNTTNANCALLGMASTTGSTYTTGNTTVKAHSGEVWFL